MGEPVQRENEREAILDAARGCFTEVGLEGSSIGVIAARCGLSEDAVRRHFATVEEIWKALIMLWSERLSAWVTNA